jgi:hypothetical protein
VIRLLALLLSLAGPALAQPDAGFTGEARTGADTRPARFAFTCSANGRNTTGALGVTLAVPRHETLRPVFDFDRFEGPDADAGRLTRLETDVAGDRLGGRFAVSGSIGVDDDQPFVFGLYAARRGDQARLQELGRILRPLTLRPGRLVWNQLNIQRVGVPILATLDIGAVESERLRVLLAPCLPR